MVGLLTLRLCKIGLEEDPVNGIDDSLHIAINDFVEGLVDLVGGYHTPAQMKIFYSMTGPEQTAFDILIGKISSATTVADKLGRVPRVRSIPTKWERRRGLDLSSYDSPDDIETHLLAIDRGF